MNLKIENNVPEVYVEQSRDFQLLCRMFDVIFNGTLVNADKIRLQLDPRTCDDRLLPLLASYLGFFPQIDIPADVVRNILSVFPTLIKYKGTEKAIRLACLAVLRFYSDLYQVNVSREEDTYNLIITSDGIIDNTAYLEEVLRYVCPAGIKYTLQLGGKVYRKWKEKILSTNKSLYIIKNPGSQIRSSLYENGDIIDNVEKDMLKLAVSRINHVKIINSKDSISAEKIRGSFGDE